MKVKILGSVSPYCKESLNCPGYLVSSDKDKVLLDCGPGITRNMKLPDDLNNLNIIISHLHKDHYGDLLSIGYASYVYHNLGMLDKRIKVYIPRDVKNDKDLGDYLLLSNFGDEHFLEFIQYDEHTKINIGDMKIDFSKNPHQIKTLSTRIVDNNNSLVYSADTGFLGNTLVELASCADILICEATFLNGQVRNGNNHLYASEAARIAKDAKVKKLVLTHFFPEIDKSLYVDEAKCIFDNTVAACENKVLKLGGKYE